jgi:hypothetical protein
MNNPAFMATAGDDGSSGDGGGSSSAGSTTRPDGSTGEPPATTTATPSTSTTDGPEPVTGTDPATTDPGDSTSTSTGVDPNDTSGLDPSTGDVVPECGNGLVEDGEQCDEALNEPMPEKCSPDCQALIGKKRIFAFNAMFKGNFMNLDVADAACTEAASDLGLDGTFKALISDGDQRIGSVASYDGKASPDWPLHPYTAYFNTDNELVWITLKRPLLGVGFENQGLPLPHAIQPDANYPVWTGLQADWISGPNCGAWTGEAQNAIAGKPYKTDIYIDAAGYLSCEIAMGLICVQQ